MTEFPRLIDSNIRLHPLSLSISETLTPVSTASMQLPKEENLPARAFVELFTPLGSAGIYRVRSPEDAYGNDITSAELEHAIAEVGDYLVKTEISEMMSAGTAMQTVFSHYGGSRWQLGSTSALSGTIAIEAKYDRVLDAMLEILKQVPTCMMTFDFTTTPWTVGFALKGSTVTAEGRLGRNIRSARVIYDDTELCTRVWYQIPSTDSSGQPTTTWTHMDADTLSTYGVIEREMASGSDYTVTEANSVALEYLRQHKNPRITVEIDAEELSNITGESLDTFTLGKLFRLALAEYSTTVEENITAISWSDVYNSPDQVSVRLGDEEDTVITFLHDVDAKGGSGGGGGAGSSIEEKFKEYRTRIEQDDYHISLVSEHADHANNILQAAGIDIDSQTGVVIYHDNVENSVGARLTVNAENISAEVVRAMEAEGTLSGRLTITENDITAEVTRATTEEGTLSGRITVEAGKITQIVSAVGANGQVTAASIVLAINQSTGQSEAKIDADHVYIGNEKSTTVIAGKLDADTVTANYIQAKIADLNVVSVASLDSQGALYSSNGYVMAPYIYIGSLGSARLVNDGIYALRLTQSGQTYTLESKTYGSDSWESVGSFNRATSQKVSGTWSGATYTVGMDDNGQSLPISTYVTVYAMPRSGQISDEFTVYAATPLGGSNYDNHASKSGQIALNSAGTYAEVTIGSVKVAQLSVNSIYTSGYNDGYADGYPSGTITIGSKVTGTVYNVSISPTSGSALATTKDFSSIYSDARAGYTQGTFTLASVTLQGSSAGLCYPALSSGGTVYYKAGSAVTLYKGDGGSYTVQGSSAGTCYPAVSSGGTVYYTAGSAATYYMGNGSKYSSEILYRKGVSKYMIGNAATPVASGPVYVAGTYYGTGPCYITTSTLYYLGSSTPILGDEISNALVPNSGGAYVLRGDSVSVTPIGSSSIRVAAGATKYNAGTYSVVSRGNTQTVTPIGSSSIRVGSSATKYNAGSTVTNTYYTKS